MKRPKLAGWHLWDIDDHYLVLTRARDVYAAVKKGKHLGASCKHIKYLGSIDA